MNIYRFTGEMTFCVDIEAETEEDAVQRIRMGAYTDSDECLHESTVDAETVRVLED